LACERAVDLGSGFDDPYLLGELCLFDYAGDLCEENFHRVCEPVANQITPDEPRPVRVDPGFFEIFSFQGLEGQVLTITMTGMAENLNLNLVLLDPRGAHLFDEDVSGGDQTALIDQLQLAESGIYIIGVYNPDSFSSEFDLALILEEANG